ncbi:MAG: small multi-drug export protein, partial [Desulfovibrionales bacterium]|nr:small multi-drug export protein [Desulfovibrionales bacterium]
MKTKLIQTVEGRILIFGFFLAFLLLGVFIYYGATDFNTAKILVSALVAHTFGGRAAGIGLCILNGYGAFITIGYNFYLEVLIVCFTYAAFVLSTTQYLNLPWLNRMMDRIAQKATAQRGKVESYGWIGIFLFVMAPLPVTGPVVGSIIGYMIHMKLARNLAATLLGTLTAIVVWFYAFEF